MRRVTLFVNGTPKNGKVVAVYGTLSDLLSVASNKLGIKATSVYNGKGGLIDDISLIRDDDVLFVCEGEPFIDPQTDVKLHEELTGSHTDWLTLNVGGRYFTTTRSTLVNKEPDSMLARMFKGKDVWGNKQDHRGAFLIDRSPEYFEPILNYLRHGQLIVNDGVNLRGVLEEARFFGIDSLIEHLEVAIKNSQPAEDHSPISRKEFVRFLLATPTKSELRCQGLNFSGADLSRLDLRYINFKMANLSGCNLAHANLCCANLERADLSGSVLDCANLQGVKMLCSNAEGASLKGCNFEDPSGLKANLEGANLKGVDMEGSQMTGINLRVATLKNAKLKNCNLRGATLAGTDLEVHSSKFKNKIAERIKLSPAGKASVEDGWEDGYIKSTMTGATCTIFSKEAELELFIQQLPSSSRMEKTQKFFVSLLLFVLSVEICLAQHWSYGLQPGGKRDAENLVESFQEIASEMEKMGELQHFECTGPQQRSMLGGLKGALASLIEGEAGRKKI